MIFTRKLLAGFARKLTPTGQIDPDGRFLDTLWDLANMGYDFGRVMWGMATENAEMAREGWKDLSLDAAAAMVPFVPAGASKAGRIAARVLDKAHDAKKAAKQACADAKTGVGEGTKVFRAWGDEAGAYGRSWTTVDPRTVPDFRNSAGLPNQNTGRFVSEGVIQDAKGIRFKAADPLHGNAGAYQKS